MYTTPRPPSLTASLATCSQASFDIMVKISKVPTSDDCPKTPVQMKSVTVA